MVFINNQFDMTLTPVSQPHTNRQILTAGAGGGHSFEQAVNINRIYQNNGLICQKKMCESLTGCSSAVGCPNHPDWEKVVNFCGPIQTGGIAMDGSYWTLQSSNARQQLLHSTEKATGMKRLPTPYNVIGMY